MNGERNSTAADQSSACGYPSGEGKWRRDAAVAVNDPLSFSSRAAHRRREFEAAVREAEKRLGDLAPDELVITYDPVMGIGRAELAGEIIYQTPLAARMPIEPPDAPEEMARLVRHMAGRITAQAAEIRRQRENLRKSRELLHQAFGLD